MVFVSSQTLQIIIGLLNIGLGIILRVNSMYSIANDTLCPVWLGVLVSNNTVLVMVSSTTEIVPDKETSLGFVSCSSSFLAQCVF